GLACAPLRARLGAGPMRSARCAREVETARVRLVEERIRGQRLLLGELVIDRLDPERTPATIRVSTPSRTPSVQPGDYVRLRAFLMPPSPPVEPGGFDFARYAYFLRLGAGGHTLCEPEV